MPKELWKECKYCGIITDSDEKHCPNRGLRDNPKHKLQRVKLDIEEVKKRCAEGKVWTKYVADFEKRLV